MKSKKKGIQNDNFYKNLLVGFIVSIVTLVLTNCFYDWGFTASAISSVVVYFGWITFFEIRDMRRVL